MGFIGSCAVIPNDSSNNNGRGTRKVVTAAHKLKNVQQNELLKIRVGEYDASGFNPPETVQHEEYTIVRLLKHPQFSAGRLSNDIAILYTDRDINLNKPNVNTACLPSCRDQFSHQFNNGTGLRCWVAGWGKNEVDGSFQFIQHKVDLPLVENNSCNNKLKNALNAQRAGSGNRFSLSQSEICAGGLYRRRRQPPCLPGTVWQVDCRWTRHLGSWMRQRCPWSLRQDVTFHPVDK